LSSGVVPPPPESGWNVDYEDAFERWGRAKPRSGADIEDVLDWINRAKADGPPTTAFDDGGGYYIDRVSGTVAVGFLVIEYEYLVLLRHIF
jgi:hypothetical protein